MERIALEILMYPERSLGIPSVEVTAFDQNLHLFLDDMHHTCKYHGGVGLAAPQVSKNIRVVVVHYEDQKYEIINPIVRLVGNKKSTQQEACLSIPRYVEYIERHDQIHVEYQDRNGTPQSLAAIGMLAHILQHEIDHLDGVLFVERGSRLKRDMFKKWFAKKVKIVETLQNRLAKQAELEKVLEEAKTKWKVNKKIVETTPAVDKPVTIEI